MLVKMIITVVKGRGHFFFSLVYSNIYGSTGKGEKISDGFRWCFRKQGELRRRVTGDKR